MPSGPKWLARHVEILFFHQGLNNLLMFTSCQENSRFITMGVGKAARSALDGCTLRAAILRPRTNVNESVPERRRALLALLQDSLEKRHWKVALRRFLMLRSFELPIPEDLTTVCELFMSRCPERELARMHQSAIDLVAMVSRGIEPEHVSQRIVDKYDYLHSIARSKIE